MWNWYLSITRGTSQLLNHSSSLTSKPNQFELVGDREDRWAVWLVRWLSKIGGVTQAKAGFNYIIQVHTLPKMVINGRPHIRTLPRTCKLNLINACYSSHKRMNWRARCKRCKFVPGEDDRSLSVRLKWCMMHMMPVNVSGYTWATIQSIHLWFKR